VTSVSGSYRDKLREDIEQYAKNIAPGLIYTLNLHCRRLAGRDCIDLFLDDPGAFRDVLVRVYGSSPTVKLVARMFIYPVKLNANLDEPLDELVKLFTENPVEFHRILQRALSGK